MPCRHGHSGCHLVEHGAFWISGRQHQDGKEGVWGIGNVFMVG